MILFFMRWMIKVWKDQSKADFKNSLTDEFAGFRLHNNLFFDIDNNERL